MRHCQPGRAVGLQSEKLTEYFEEHEAERVSGVPGGRGGGGGGAHAAFPAELLNRDDQLTEYLGN
jgi:hypothetical protein